MKEIILFDGSVCFVDDEDYELVSKYKWHNSKGYARGWVDGKKVLMHRLIMGLSDKTFIDHIDGNRVNNTRSNLRRCSNTQNTRNMESKRGNSKYKGVCYHKTKGKYQANIRVDGKLLYLGTYEKEEDAAIAYNLKAQELFGLFAKVNDIKIYQ